MSREYRDKNVAGLIFETTEPRLERCSVTIRMTSDEIGQSLSLQAENVMIEIPLEQVADIIQVPKKGKWSYRYDPEDKPFFRKKYYCSCCGDWNTYGMSDYCPNCGAEMERPDEK